MTLAAWLDQWLEVQRTRLAPSTWASYRGNVDRYILPALGTRRLDDLGPAEITALYARLLRSGGHCGKPLSLRTVQYCHAILHGALADAVKLELLERNPAARASCPQRDPDARDTDELRVWTPEQTRAFLAHVAGDAHRELWELAIATGMRRGELLGLSWDDVDTDRRLLHVRRALSVVDGTVRLKHTKTNRSRSLSVDEHALAALERRRRSQARDATAAGWDNSWNLVFTTETGAPLDPGRITHAFARVVRAAPVPRIRLHDLRHLHATQMLAAGVPVPVVSQRLGHATVTMTLNTYAHVLPAMDADAVALFAARMYEEDAIGMLESSHGEHPGEERA